MAVSGLPEVCNDHAKSIANLALDLMDAAKELRNPNNHLIEVNQVVDSCSQMIVSCGVLAIQGMCRRPCCMQPTLL